MTQYRQDPVTDASELVDYIARELHKVREEFERNEQGHIVEIHAEENAALVTNTYQWAYGDGAAATVAEGIVIPFDMELVAVSGHVTGTGTYSAGIHIVRNGTPDTNYGVTCTNTTPDAYAEFDERFSVAPLIFEAGDLLNFRTGTVSGTTSRGMVAAWLRLRQRLN